jgi:hypothetical protein
VTPRLLSFAAALLALWPLAAAAQETPRSPREDRVMKALIGLPHSRHLDTLKELGITPEGGFLDCLCRSAGYGSSTTAQFYHPDTIGEYNRMYSCSQPGEPCVVSGFGCMRYPMPSDPAIWDSCGREFPGEGGGNLIDKMLKEISKRGDKPAANYRAELAQCRGNWSAGLGGNPAQDWQDGLKYLGNAGAQLLPPPPKLAAKMKAEAQNERSKLADKVKAATAKAETDWKKLAADKIYADVIQNPDTYAAAASLAEELANLELTALDVKSNDRTAAWKKLAASGLEPEEMKFAHEIYRKDMADLDARKKAIKRDIWDFGAVQTTVDVAKDLKKLEKQWGDLNSGDARKQAGAVVGATGTLNKYLGKLKTWSTADLKGLSDKVKDKGLSDKEYAALQALTTRSEVMQGLTDAIGETTKAATWALKGYDAFQQFKKDVALAESYAVKGNYTAAQRRMLLAFEGMSRLTAAGAEYLPPGISDMMGFYAEAMKTPAQFDAFIRDVVNKGDVHAETTGDQAKTPAMQAYIKAHFGIGLDREDYLYRQAGISAYRMDKADKGHLFVLIPRADGQPVYLDQANYERLMEAAYLYPIAEGRRMTDADVFEMTWKQTDGATISIDALRKKAEEKIKAAAGHQKIAAMFGQKSVSNSDALLWWDFQKALSAALPARCVLDMQSMKALFSGFRDPAARDGVLEQIARYGAALKAVEAEDTRTAAPARN